ncbi:MAG TPA: O-antigen ligase family protein [Candidatus Limnocylindria bacterium]|nr:O-antigen ligase family protein [Candidatus Limnocylindria bacterium]
MRPSSDARRLPFPKGLGTVTISRDALRILVAMAALLVLGVIAARFSTAVFVAIGVALLAGLAVISWRAPRLILLTMALMPIFDRYLISLLIPPSLSGVTNFFSEGLLLLAAIVVTIRAWRDGRLLPALRHPTTPLLAGFVAVGLVGAILNGVPPVIATAGILFTIDAIALYVLPRFVGYEPRQAAIAAGVFVALAGVASLLAIFQITLAPTIFGMEVSHGRFSEGNRVAAFFDGNPNMLAAVIAMAVPYPAFAVRFLRGRARIAAMVLLVIMALALFYTFSRGAWLGLGLSMVVVGLIIDWRALALVIVAGVLAYGAAHVMPRNLLVGLFSSGGGPGPEVTFDLGEATFGRVESLGGGRDLRVLFIENATPIIADHPLVGAGPGRYGGAVSARFPDSPLYDRYTDGVVPEGRTVDNFWLHLLVEFGVLGTLLYAGILAFAIAQSIWFARGAPAVTRVVLAGSAAAAIILVIDSLTEMLLEGNTTSFAAWFFLGIGSALVAGERLRRAASSRVQMSESTQTA